MVIAMSEPETDGTERPESLDNWRTDGWKYRGEGGVGVYETRHEAVGAAAVAGRKERERREEHAPSWAPLPTVIGYTGRVHAFKPFRCGYCGEVFLTEAEHDEHQTCPHYEATEGRRGSNPVEAAYMAGRGR